jgi:hypothetical protein
MTIFKDIQTINTISSHSQQRMITLVADKTMWIYVGMPQKETEIIHHTLPTVQHIQIVIDLEVELDLDLTPVHPHLEESTQDIINL